MAFSFGNRELSIRAAHVRTCVPGVLRAAAGSLPLVRPLRFGVDPFPKHGAAIVRGEFGKEAAACLSGIVAWALLRRCSGGNPMIHVAHRMAVLEPAVRSLVLQLSGTRNLNPTAALAAFSSLPLDVREHLPVKDTAQLVFDLAYDVSRARSRRTYRYRKNRQLDLASPFARERATLAKRLDMPLTTRFGRFSENAVIAASKRVMHWGGAGGTEWHVEAATDDDVGYSIGIRKGADIYRTSYKRHPALIDSHVIKIPERWPSRVFGIGDGSGVIHRYLILNTEMIGTSSHDKRVIYKARAARSSRGYSVVVETVYICCWARDATAIYKSYRRALDAAVPDIVTARSASSVEGMSASK
ncbi:hypothetical protein [Methylobacterium sp. J-070]|uniref:hypothetical protein n=1 Tax=Methylobacterium sp. J-070 TaxID=2836650 RepID=UPI001FBBEA47|nr:hypothetical protein [Methylobacterium sp. J-070]MCJ2052542.1 hypothetical protein [Methylobacterium sp. J-070]